VLFVVTNNTIGQASFEGAETLVVVAQELDGWHARGITHLTAENTAALTQTLSGLGGVGKTQLALEYAYRHVGDYEGVWWLRAEEPVTLASDYAALIRRILIPL
jgi:hypothetical protein